MALVTSGSDEIISLASGHAQRADGIPNSVETRFAQASGTKTLTAIAVARLVEEGRFEFTTKMAEILDLWPGAFGDEVTVQHLLTHTSGIPDYFDEDAGDNFEALWQDVPSYSVRSPADLLPLFVDANPKFPPGERFAYCNSGFVMLGLLIEQHSGSSFSDFIQTRVLDRAGMASSGFFPLDRLPARTALNYLTDEDRDRPRANLFAVPAYGQPDGGSFVTAKDMARFWKAVMDNRLLSTEVTGEVLRQHVVVAEDRGYGYGLWVDDRRDVRIHFALGEDPGVNFLSGMCMDRDITVTVISNTDDPVGTIFWGIVDLISA